MLFCQGNPRITVTKYKHFTYFLQPCNLGKARFNMEIHIASGIFNESADFPILRSQGFVTGSTVVCLGRINEHLLYFRK